MVRNENRYGMLLIVFSVTIKGDVYWYNSVTRETSFTDPNEGFNFLIFLLKYFKVKTQEPIVSNNIVSNNTSTSTITTAPAPVPAHHSESKSLKSKITSKLGKSKHISK
jgi:hypothetical protein